MHKRGFDSLVDLIEHSAEHFAEKTAFKIKRPISYHVAYKTLYDYASRFASVLREHYGIEKGDKIAIFSENRIEWMIADLGTLMLGAIDVPRGAHSSLEEYEYIIRHSEAKLIIAENEKLYKKICKISNLPKVLAIERIENSDVSIPLFWDLINQAGPIKRRADIKPDDIATIIYTSGTTGKPKGVMLRHSNILHNVRTLPKLFPADTDSVFLSILPIWHMLERTVEYTTMSVGAMTVYTDRFNFARDLKEEDPTHMVSVPRVWRAIYDKIWETAKKLGKDNALRKLIKLSTAYIKALKVIQGKNTSYKRTNIADIIKALFKVGALFPLHQAALKLIYKKIRKEISPSQRLKPISGGGALEKAVDEFFEAIGLPIYEGYGLTETSPIVATRFPGREVLYTIGPPLPETDVKIINEKGIELPPGEKGELIVRGPQVMAGYYKNEEATVSALKDGWLHTGDLATKTYRGELQIIGRIKDTIVLSTGENIEPDRIELIESRICESPFIKNAMLVGQDRPVLGVLVVLAEEYSNSRNINAKQLFKEIRNLLACESFKQNEMPTKIAIVPELKFTQTMKLERKANAKRYAQIIEEMYGGKHA